MNTAQRMKDLVETVNGVSVPHDKGTDAFVDGASQSEIKDHPKSKTNITPKVAAGGKNAPEPAATKYNAQECEK